MMLDMPRKRLLCDICGATLTARQNRLKHVTSAEHVRAEKLQLYRHRDDASPLLTRHTIDGPIGCWICAELRRAHREQSPPSSKSDARVVRCCVKSCSLYSPLASTRCQECSGANRPLE